MLYFSLKRGQGHTSFSEFLDIKINRLAKYFQIILMSLSLWLYPSFKMFVGYQNS